MTAIALLNAWLRSTQNYQEGVDLYEHYGDNEALKRLFKTKSSFTVAKLKEAISKLIQGSSLAVQSLPEPQKQQLPPDVQKIEAARIALFKDTAHLHAQLKTIPEGVALYQQAVQIKSNWRQIDEYWNQINYFKKHGQLPVPAAGIELETDDPIKLMERVRNLSTYISKHRANKKKADQVAAWEAEKVAILKKLKQ